MKRTLEADIEPQYNLIDSFWNAGFRVPGDIVTLLTAMAPGSPLSVDVPMVGSANRQTVLRFVQGPSTCTVSGDYFLSLDRRSSDSILTAAWSNTTKIDTDVFSLTKRHRCRYANYRSAARLLSHILESALSSNEPLFTVVLVCREGKERSLVVLLVLLMMLHGLHLMGRNEEAQTLDERVAYMTKHLFHIQLGALAVTRHSTDKFKMLFNQLGMQLASLPLYTQ